MRDLIGSMLALVALVAVLISVDDRARAGFDQLMTDAAETGWSNPPSATIGAVIVDVTSHRHGDSVYLISFLAAAALLVLLMLRT
jgi:hypothetical protein